MGKPSIMSHHGSSAASHHHRLQGGVSSHHHRMGRNSSERRRVLKMCVRKLQNIEDPETYLCRSVLINNTLRNLQALHREAKLKKERQANLKMRLRIMKAQQEREEEEEEDEERQHVWGGHESSEADGHEEAMDYYSNGSEEVIEDAMVGENDVGDGQEEESEAMDGNGSINRNLVAGGNSTANDEDELVHHHNNNEDEDGSDTAEPDSGNESNTDSEDDEMFDSENEEEESSSSGSDEAEPEVNDLAEDVADVNDEELAAASAPEVAADSDGVNVSQQPPPHDLRQTSAVEDDDIYADVMTCVQLSTGTSTGGIGGEESLNSSGACVSFSTDDIFREIVMPPPLSPHFDDLPSSSCEVGEAPHCLTDFEQPSQNLSQQDEKQSTTLVCDSMPTSSQDNHCLISNKSTVAAASLATASNAANASLLSLSASVTSIITDDTNKQHGIEVNNDLLWGQLEKELGDFTADKSVWPDMDSVALLDHHHPPTSTDVSSGGSPIRRSATASLGQYWNDEVTTTGHHDGGGDANSAEAVNGLMLLGRAASSCSRPEMTATIDLTVIARDFTAHVNAKNKSESRVDAEDSVAIVPSKTNTNNNYKNRDSKEPDMQVVESKSGPDPCHANMTRESDSESDSGSDSHSNSFTGCHPNYDSLPGTTVCSTHHQDRQAQLLRLQLPEADEIDPSSSLYSGHLHYHAHHDAAAAKSMVAAETSAVKLLANSTPAVIAAAHKR